MRRPGWLKLKWWKAKLAGAPGLLLSAAFIGFSASMTAVGGYGMGEAKGLGWMTAVGMLAIEAAVDLSIPLWWRHLRFLLRIVFVAFFAVLLIFKLEAARFFAAENWGARDAEIAKAAGNYDIATKQVESLQKKIADNVDARAATIIQNEIDRQLLEPGTDGCPAGVAWNGPVTKKVCPKVAKLREELARAKIRDQAEIDLVPALKEWREAKPVATRPEQERVGIIQFLLALVGISTSWTAVMSTLWMIAFEGGAIIIPIIVERASREGRKPEPEGEAFEPALAQKSPQAGPETSDTNPPQGLPEGLTDRARRDLADVTAFLRECCERTPGQRVQATPFYFVYCEWKQERSETAMSLAQFGIVLTRHLGLSKVKSDGKNWYQGVRLRHPAQGRQGGQHLRAIAA
jgi:hypothetical protein